MRSAADGGCKIIDLGTAWLVDQRSTQISRASTAPHLTEGLATVSAPQIRFAGTPVYASPGGCLSLGTAALCTMLFPTSELGRCGVREGRNQHG